MACCHGGVRIRICRFGVPAVVAETARTSSCLVRGDAVLCIGRRDGGVVRVFWVMGSYRIPPLHCAGCFSCGFLGIGVTVPGGQAPDMGAPISGGCACVSDCFSWGSLHHRSHGRGAGAWDHCGGASFRGEYVLSASDVIAFQYPGIYISVGRGLALGFSFHAAQGVCLSRVGQRLDCLRHYPDCLRGFKGATGCYHRTVSCRDGGLRSVAGWFPESRHVAQGSTRNRRRPEEGSSYGPEGLGRRSAADAVALKGTLSIRERGKSP